MINISDFIFLQADGFKFEPSALYRFALAIHSVLRYAVLIFIVYAIFQAWNTWKSSKPFNRKPAFFTFISVDIMFLLGIYMWVITVLDVTSNFTNNKRFIKAPPEVRFQILEHPILMFIAIVLIHIGYSKSKKAATDQLKGKRIFIYYLIALLLILAAIPWPFLSHGAGRNWIPSF